MTPTAVGLAFKRYVPGSNPGIDQFLITKNVSELVWWEAYDVTTLPAKQTHL